MERKREKMKKVRKAVAAALTPVAVILLSWAATGQLDTQELAVAIAGLLSVVFVYFIPNDYIQPPTENQGDPESEVRRSDRR